MKKTTNSGQDMCSQKPKQHFLWLVELLDLQTSIDDPYDLKDTVENVKKKNKPKTKQKQTKQQNQNTRTELSQWVQQLGTLWAPSTRFYVCFTERWTKGRSFSLNAWLKVTIVQKPPPA